MRKFSYNTDIYYVRTDINEFLREHPFVSDLYDATLQCLFGMGYTKEEALNVFNQAYYICTLIVENEGDRHDILRLINDDDFEKDSDDYTFIGLILTVAKCLLRVHQELVQFDSNIIKWLGSVISANIDSSQFNHVVSNYAGDFDKTLNFSGKTVEVPIEEKSDFENPSAMIMKAQSLIEEAREKLLICNEKKDERIAELEEQLRLEREKNSTLASRITTLENSTNVENDAVDIESIDEIYNAINYQTIKEFAMGRKEAESSVISNMLGKLALRSKLGLDSLARVNTAIEEIDSVHNPRYLLQPKQINCEKYVENEFHNENKDSQVFNGKIDNSQFGK